MKYTNSAATRNPKWRNGTPRSSVRCLCQSLEPRKLFATVNWDGGPTGDGTNFLDPVNWAGDALPLAADTAVIGATGSSPTITVSGTPAVQTITSSRNIQMTGGTLSGGTLAFSGGAALLASPTNSTLSNVAITGDVLLNSTNAAIVLNGNTTFTAARLSASNTNLFMRAGYTLNSLVVSEGTAGGNRAINLGFAGAGTVTFGPSAVVRLAAGSVGQMLISQSQVTTLVNNGLISAEGAGQNLAIQNTTLTNSGTLQVTAGTMTVQPSGWTNPGTLTGTGGTLNLGGIWNATAGIGTCATSALTVNLFGTITNTGSTITLDAATGPWRLAGGTINNGAINESGVNLLATSSGGTLNSVAVTGDLLLNTLDSVVLLAGNTSFSAARLSGPNSRVRMAAGYTLNSLIVSEGTAGGNRSIDLGFAGGGTITFGPSAVVRTAAGSIGQLLITQSQVSTLVNNGLISSEAAGQNISIAPTAFTNNATLQTASTGAISVNSSWTNSGTVTGAGGTFNLGGNFNATAGIGTFSTSAVTVNLTGTINNTGNTITLNAATGAWRLAGGTINNGAIVESGVNLVTTSSGGNLNSVVVTGDLLLNTTDARVVLGGNTTFTAARLSGSNSRVQLAPGATLNSLVVSEGTAGGNRSVDLGFGGGGTFTFGPSAVVRTAAGSVGQLLISQSQVSTLVNNGLITAEGSGQNLLIQPTAFTNNGMLLASNGSRLTVSSNIGGNPGHVRADGLGSILTIQTGTYTVNQQANATNNGLIYFAGTPTKAATFDASGRFVIEYTGAANTPFAQVKADVISGYSGGTWNGPGINSTAAAATPRTAVGYAEASSVLSPTGGVFAGVNVDGTSVLVRYTLAGDADLSGNVNLADFTRLAASFGSSSSWSSGDFTYDGATNLDDFTALAANFGLSVPALSDAPRAARGGLPGLRPSGTGEALLIDRSEKREIFASLPTDALR